MKIVCCCIQRCKCNQIWSLVLKGLINITVYMIGLVLTPLAPCKNMKYEIKLEATLNRQHRWVESDLCFSHLKQVNNSVKVIKTGTEKVNTNPSTCQHIPVYYEYKCALYNNSLTIYYNSLIYNIWLQLTRWTMLVQNRY